MKCWMIKARHRHAKILSEEVGPDEGWFFVLDVPLSEIPRKDFSIKKPRFQSGDVCPECDRIMGVGHGDGLFIGCGHCGYETDWVYAKYRIVWRG